MILLQPVTQREAWNIIDEWHSHHKPPVGSLYQIGAYFDGFSVGVVVVGRPVSGGLPWPILEVTRLCTNGHKNAASRLLGAAWCAARAMGCRRMVSYTRDDERGTCCQAASWLKCAEVKGRPWNTGNKANRWLPGMYQPTTEIVDRVRWEIGPDAMKPLPKTPTP